MDPEFYDNLRLIAAVKKRPYIYNIKARLHYNELRINSDWYKISKESYLPSIEEAKSRWDDLRNSFNLHVKTSGRIPCKYYREMEFLREYINIQDDDLSSDYFGTPSSKDSKSDQTTNPSTSQQNHTFKPLKLYYQNVRGLNGKFKNFLRGSSNSIIDMFCITETWLRSFTHSTDFIDDNIYNVYRSDRSSLFKERGGGVLMAIKKSFCTVPLDLSKISSNFYEIDFLGVTFFLQTDNIHVFVIYVPPDLLMEKYEKFIDQLIEEIIKLEGKILILGDFNVPELSSSTSTGKPRFLNFFCQVLRFSQFNNNYNASGVCLDLIFSNAESINVQSTDPIVREDNHHPALKVTIF